MKIRVLGGDGRMDYAALCLQRAGHEVIREGLPEDGEAIVLPVRTVLTEQQLRAAIDRGCYIIGGRLPVHGERFFDYMQDEAFLYENARITAEGAAVLLGTHLEGTVYGCDVGIVGMGRIAECLCMILHGMGARVTVYARRPEVLCRARAMGADTVCFSGKLPDEAVFHDALLNTVPTVLLDGRLLDKAVPGLLYLELASPPGGIDREAAERCGVHYVNGQGIPGKYAPHAAGELIAAYVDATLERGMER